MQQQQSAAPMNTKQLRNGPATTKIWHYFVGQIEGTKCIVHKNNNDKVALQIIYFVLPLNKYTFSQKV
jgi:hypothetical protein